MKVITCCLLFSLFSISAFNQSNDVLLNIEERIQEAQDLSFAHQSDKIAPLLAELDASPPLEWLSYWQAYAAYQGSVYLMVSKNEKGANAYAKKGIDYLSAKQTLNSEEYALLGSILSLSITFNPGETIGLSSKARKNYKKALKANPDNLRALLGIGRSDFYKPKQYGGGKEVESYLLKALAAPDQILTDAEAPTWGRDDAYYYLAAFYGREGRIDDAKLYCTKGLKEFPMHHLLSELLAKL